VHKFGGKGDDDGASPGDGAAATKAFVEALRKVPSGWKAQGDLHVFADECHRTQSGDLHKAMKALLFGEQPVGLFNHSTGDQINFLRTDPPLLWRRCDGAWIAGVTVACTAGFAVLSWPWLLVGVPLVVLRSALAVCVRLLRCCSIRTKVDAALAVAARAAQPRPKLRRVK
jgi:hypothetical protein